MPEMILRKLLVLQGNFLIPGENNKVVDSRLFRQYRQHRIQYFTDGDLFMIDIMMF